MAGDRIVRLVSSQAKPKKRRVGDPEQWICRVCETDIGVKTSAVVEVTVAPRLGSDGRPQGGTKRKACAHCLARGVMTYMT